MHYVKLIARDFFNELKTTFPGVNRRIMEKSEEM